MKLGQSAAATDPGRRRRHNEDAYVCEPPLFAVADGIGGAQAGELASSLAAEAVRDDSSNGQVEGRMRVDGLIQEANRRVYQRQSEDASLSGMGTTMTVAFVDDSRVWIGHVGDSRAYLVREDKLEQLTEDHSLVAELVRSGRLSPEEADTHPQRSVVTRALGTDPDVDVDTFSIDARPGDLFMICSDGLTSMVSDDAILDEIRKHREDLRGTAKALVRAANRGGGEDNITVVFFEIQGSEDVGERTAILPPPQSDSGPDDEDTLDELDGVPAVQVRKERREHPVRRRVVFVVLLLVLVLAAGALGVWGLWRSHFVGAESNGHVAVYQGVPWNVAGNLHLYRTVYESPLLVSQLSRKERQKLFDHSLRSKSSAIDEVRTYEEQLGR